MRLIRLKLENFRQHVDSTIEFHDGMTAIVGPNGAGKSTILEAITFALYGQQRDTRETIRFYWSDSKKFAVVLEFEFNGRRYIVERKNNDASLMDVTDKMAVLATGLSEVPRACERLMCLSYRQFKNSFCAEQKELAFLNFPAATRQEEVGRMLGIDRIKAAEELAKSRRSDFRIRAEALERSLGSVEALQQEKKEAEERLNAVESALRKAAQQLEALNGKLELSAAKRLQAEKWNQLTAELNVVRGEAGALKDAVQITEKSLNQTKKEIEERAQLQPMVESFERSERENKRWEELREAEKEREVLALENERLQKETSALEARLRQVTATKLPELDQELQDAGKRLEAAQIELKRTEGDWQSARVQAESELATAKAHLGQAEVDLRKSKDMLNKGKCPECGQPIKGDYQQIVDRCFQNVREKLDISERMQKVAEQKKEKPAAVTRFEGEVSRLTALIQALTTKREEAIAGHAAAEALQLDIASKRERLEELKSRLSKMPSQYSRVSHMAVQSEIERLRPMFHRAIELKGCEGKLAERTEEYNAAVARLEEAKARYKAAEEARATLPFSGPEEAQQAILAHQALQDERRDAESQLKHNQELQTFAQKNLEQATQRLQDYHAKAADLKQARASLVQHEVTAKELRQLRERLNTTIRPDLAARASETLNLLTGGRYPVLELNESFEPTLIEDGIPKPVISGGEEDVVALALRLALSELIQEWNGRPMSLLILDEVFGSLDVERRQSVLDRLAALKGRFDQILVISHIEEINQVADQCLYLRRDPETRGTTVTDSPGLIGEFALV